MAHNQKFYDMVETVIAENYEMFSLIENDETIKLAYADELEEDFETGEYSLIDLKSNLKANMITNQEYAEEQYGVDEETFNQFVLISKDLGWDLKNELLERADDIQIYNMEEQEFVTYMIEELQLLGDVPDKALYFFAGNKSVLNDVWESMLRFDFSEVPNVGYVYTSL